ncbi:arrestin domain-containing protein 3 isoform X2 [Patella vulgata]|uniref:arrestin domain-containing protein 3 isoform X2 n=1 Tax=Patella vulgata TaxID=6465 RepID=UPI00217FBEF9|nr:arrestin domain-containing protein 3 isoform X2 [Patella vulgata]
MGKLDLLEINFTNNQEVFYGGQLVQGHVTVQLNAEIKMRRLEEKGDDHVLQPGNYSYPFSFQLPNQLPSSYESSVGRVRYTVTAVIDRPWKFDHKCKRTITFIDAVDLNLEPTAAQGVTQQGEKTMCCLCCKSGPIRAVLKLDRLGYVPGENIRIHGEINNHSRRKMTSSFAELRMTVDYHTPSKTRTQKNSVSKICKGPIQAGGDDIWNGDALGVPPLPPSNLRGCKIIDIKYTVTLNVDPAGPAFDLVVPIKIIIGTIPLRSVAQQYGVPGPMPSSIYLSDHPNIPVKLIMPEVSMSLPPVEYVNVSPSNMSNNQDIPPPAYVESYFGKVDVHDDDDNEHTRGNMEYAPVYAYYNWNEHNTNTFLNVAPKK